MFGLEIVDVVGYFASGITMVSLLPQLYKLLKTRDVSGVSMPMFIMIASSATLWVIYGLMLNSVPIIMTNVVALLVSGSNIFLIIKLRRDLRLASPAPAM